MTQYKHIINRVYEMEHRVVCTLYTLGGNPCPSHTCPEGEVHHPNRFLCELEKVSQRIEAFLANLKYVMQNLDVKIDGSTLNSEGYVPPKIDTESARMAYTFAAIHRLVDQSGQLKYDSVIE
ncbi:uncharacterized protein LOC141900451 [Tubulanus polymorphus]|uniref:uncharacterized protein LOC141900451 n=1 Tax=Tubulanus polymorphus TaxID=672921 RepID=UPI003DA26390